MTLLRLCETRLTVSLLSVPRQNILHLSALRTSLQFIPLGVAGAITSWGVGIGVNYIKIRTLVLVGLALSFISVIPVAVMKVEHGFWGTVFPGTMIGGASAAASSQ